MAIALPEMDVPEVDIRELISSRIYSEEEAELPEVSELDIMRHYTALSTETMVLILDFIHLVHVR